MTATVEEPRTAGQQKTRTARYRHLTENLGTLDMAIVKGKKVEEFSYYVEDLGTDYDDRNGSTNAYRCFRLTKARHQQKPGEPSNYDIQIDPEAESAQHKGHSCECLGFLRWGKCKHVSSLFALIRNGKI